MKLRMPARLAEPGAARCANCGRTGIELSDIPDLCARCVLETNAELHICYECGREWTEAGDAHCANCHRHFSSDSAFDLHQRLDHRPCKGHPQSRCAGVSVCQDPATLRKRDGSLRLVQLRTDAGLTWSEPEMSPEAIARLRGRP